MSQRMVWIVFVLLLLVGCQSSGGVYQKSDNPMDQSNERLDQLNQDFIEISNRLQELLKQEPHDDQQFQEVVQLTQRAVEISEECADIHLVLRDYAKQEAKDARSDGFENMATAYDGLAAISQRYNREARQRARHFKKQINKLSKQ